MAEIPTPNKVEIEELAKQRFMEYSIKNKIEAITPKHQELREGGWLSLAQSEPVRDKYRAEIENDYVNFSYAFTVNLKELFESNGLILGSRHTGKSDVAMRICDRAKRESVVVVFDPSSDWIARSSIRHYIKVDPHMALDVSSESVIYDISLLSPIQQQRTVEQFSKGLFETQAESSDRKQYLVLFEEAQIYFPQGCMRAKRIQNTVRLLSVGRNVNIACVLISQFASMLDKFAVKHSTSQAWFGYTREPNDLHYLRQILGKESEELQKLSDGEFLYLNRSEITKIQIQPYRQNITKTELKPTTLSIPKQQTERLYRKSEKSNTLAPIIVATMWFIAILMAIFLKG